MSDEPKRMLRYNNGKPPLSLLPTSLIRAVGNGTFFSTMPTLLLDDTALVLGFGAQKYTAENWRKGGPWKEVLDCAMRHMHKIFRKESHDLESGIHHAAHVACNIGFLLEFIESDTATDDRYAVQLQTNYKTMGELDAVYNLLLIWKDGGEASTLRLAIQNLAVWYEKLPAADRALREGTSPFAFKKVTPEATVYPTGPLTDEDFRLQNS